MSNKTYCCTADGITIVYDNGKKVNYAYDPLFILNFKKAETVSYPELNSVQNTLFKKLVFGLAAFAHDEVETMNYAYKMSIIRNYNHARSIIHKVKVEKNYERESKFLDNMFPNSKFPLWREKPIEFYKVDVPSNITLKYLDVSILDVVKRFINENLLPKEFFSIESRQLAI